MSQESTTPDPVELVRRQFEGGNRRDLDAVTSNFAPDAVLDGRVLGDHFEGRPAIRSFIEDWFGPYEELEFGLEEVRHLGKGVVFAVVTQNGRPVGTSGFVQQREGWVYVFGDGLIKRATVYHDIDQARAAAERLAEERASTAPDLAELVRQRTHALFRGELDMDTFLGGYATDAVWDMTRQGLTLQGRTEIGAFVEEWLAGFEDLEVTVAEARELGNGVVFAVFHQRGRPVGTSGFVQQRDCWVSVFGDGLIKRATVYHDIDEARAAAERLAKERG